MGRFLKEMKLVVPNCQRMNRGGHTISEILETCRADGFTDLLVLQEHRGVPDGLVVSPAWLEKFQVKLA